MQAELNKLEEKNGSSPILPNPYALTSVLETKLRPRRNRPSLAPTSPAQIVRLISGKPMAQALVDQKCWSAPPPRKPVTIPAGWTGKALDGKNVTLEEDYLRMSFGDTFVDELKKCN